MSTEVLGSGPAESLPEHTKIGPYRLVQELGQGGMGVVHLALDPNGRAVALKVLRPHIAHDPMARARLAREVDTLSRITDPGVAPVLDADIEGDRPYLVTRYVPGPSLDDVVRAEGPLQGADLRRLGQGLARSLEAIHAADVIHRDLKPGNVLLLDGEPVLIDFGIAHIADDIRLTSTGLVMGTPGYLSPEIVEGGEVTRATDWWGWAATVAFGASGRPPFGKGPMDVVLTRVSRGEADLTGVDPLLAPLLAAALTPDAALRPSVQEVLAALDAYSVGRSTTAVLDRRPERGATALLPVAATAAYAADPAARAEPVPPSGRGSEASEAQGPPAPVGPAIAPAAALAAYTAPGEAYAPADNPYATAAGRGGVAPQATTWQGGVEHADPRIGRANRSGVLAALGALVVAGCAVAPVVTAASVVAWLLLARTADRSVTSLVLRRHASGVRRSDLPVAVISGPWHLLVAAVATVMSAIVPVLVGVSTAFCTALAVSAVTGGPIDPATSVPLAAGGLLATWVAWWGPGGASLRRGTRSVVRGVTAGVAARQAIVALLLLGVVALGAWAYFRHGAPMWWPRTGRPTFAVPTIGW